MKKFILFLLAACVNYPLYALDMSSNGSINGKSVSPSAVTITGSSDPCLQVGTTYFQVNCGASGTGGVKVGTSAVFGSAILSIDGQTIHRASATMQSNDYLLNIQDENGLSVLGVTYGQDLKFQSNTNGLCWAAAGTACSSANDRLYRNGGSGLSVVGGGNTVATFGSGANGQVSIGAGGPTAAALEVAPVNSGINYVLSVASQTNTTKIFNVMASGNVGIGTTNPANRLDVAGGANAFAVGTSTLTVSNGIADIGSQPYINLNNLGTAQTVTTNAWSLLSWGTAIKQTNMFYVTTASQTITVPVAGRYLNIVRIPIAPAIITDNIGIDVFVNGSQTGVCDLETALTTASHYIECTVILDLNANDALTAMAYDSGGGGVIANTAGFAKWQVYKVP